MSLNEADTRAQLIDPALHSLGWSADMIPREQTVVGICIESLVIALRARL